MPIYALGDLEPRIDASAYVHPDAVVIGDVHLGPESSVWPGAVLRGDYGRITIGARTSVQDGSVLHATATHPTVVGSDCVIGHNVHLEGCTIEDRVLVGSGSVVMHDVVARSGSVVGAGAVVHKGMELPAGAMALGVPARVKPAAVRRDFTTTTSALYVGNARRYALELRRLS